MRLKIDKNQQTKKIWFLGSDRIWCRKTDDWNSIRILFSESKIAGCDPDERNQNCSYKENDFDYRV